MANHKKADRNKWPDLANIRREYGDLSLSKHSVKSNPVDQFQLWFDEVILVEKSDPTAMLLSTVDERGRPDSRVVLLKGIIDENFIFYTNYLSTKGKQLEHTPYAALNFFWPQLVRQVRIRGTVNKIAPTLSDQYFASRPTLSQLSALASPQSEEVESRDVLDARLNDLIEQYGQKSLVRPKHWGGYQVMPEEFEFWQGRDNRMHDRMHYYKQGHLWKYRRLAP